MNRTMDERTAASLLDDDLAVRNPTNIVNVKDDKHPHNFHHSVTAKQILIKLGTEFGLIFIWVPRDKAAAVSSL